MDTVGKSRRFNMANVSTIKDDEKHPSKKKIKITTLHRIIPRGRDNHQLLNLPSELLRKILESLSLADQIRLSLICKESRSLSLCDDRLVDQLPWLVSCSNSNSDGFVCQLFDVMHDKPYTTLRITGQGMDSFRPDYVASKHGWLFFLREIESLTAKIFLFCPYTKETIVLPNLHHGVQEVSEYDGKDRMRIATFSLQDPKSQECVFFVLYYIYDSFGAGIVTCSYKHGDKGWKTKVFDDGHQVLRVIRFTNVVYLQEYLYLANCDGTLGAYDVVRERWYVFNTSSRDVANKHGCFHLIVSKGMLLLSTILCYNSVSLSCCKLFRMSWSKMEWVRKQHFKTRALFLGHQPLDSSFAIPISVGDLGHVPCNKIFFHNQVDDNGKIRRFYDLKECKPRECEGTGFELFLPRKKGMIWIEPPHHVLKLHTTESMEKPSRRKSTPNLSLARR